MANTTYQQIYDAFLDRITDYDFAAYSEGLQSELLYSYMQSALGRFGRICRRDLDDRDDETGEFNVELTIEEIDVITAWMEAEWLKQYMHDSDNLHNRINTAEFSSVSPANMLASIKDSYENTRKQALSLMNKYSYIHGDYDSLKT